MATKLTLSAYETKGKEKYAMWIYMCKMINFLYCSFYIFNLLKKDCILHPFFVTVQDTDEEILRVRYVFI